MARIFLSSRFDHARRMEEYARVARELGHDVTSRWHNGSHDIPNATDAEKRVLSQEDEEDLYAADTLIFFAEPQDTESRNGGRHVEFGMARARGLRICVVDPHAHTRPQGRRENIFHYLGTVADHPQIEHYTHFRSALLALPAGGDPPMRPSATPANPRVHRAVLLDGAIAAAVRFAANIEHLDRRACERHLSDVETLLDYAYSQPVGPRRTRQHTLIRAFKALLEERVHDIRYPAQAAVETDVLTVARNQERPR